MEKYRTSLVDFLLKNLNTLAWVATGPQTFRLHFPFAPSFYVNGKVPAEAQEGYIEIGYNAFNQHFIAIYRKNGDYINTIVSTPTYSPPVLEQLIQRLMQAQAKKRNNPANMQALDDMLTSFVPGLKA